MTKRKMIEAMIEGLKFTNNEMVINTCMKQSYEYVKKVYNWYNNAIFTLSNSSIKDTKRFAIHLLNRF